MIRSLILALAALTLPLSAKAQLVIAGGGLERETANVWQAFLGMAGDNDGSIVIVPSASGSPAGSVDSVRETLNLYGVADDRIAVAALAMMDDRDTPDVDEALWAANADDAGTVALLQGAAAIWFTGGDQSRTTQILLPDGRETPALRAIRDAHSQGTPIGGTSAGAAIMSASMIRQGDSLTALTGSNTGESLELGDGLGFLPGALIDQHFGERARLGRLAAALMRLPEGERRVGFGIDENTALIPNGRGQATVAGTGYVTVLDARAATSETIHGALKIMNLTLHMISAGDRIDRDTLDVVPAQWKTATVDNEYVRSPAPGGGGMALPGQSLAEVIGEGLVDNVASKVVERVSFDGDGAGVRYHFAQLPGAQGYWGRGPEGRGRYAITGVGFAIEPVRVTVDSLTPER